MADNSVGTATLQDNAVTFPKAILAMQNPIVLTIRITVSSRGILYLYNPYGFNCVYSNPSVGSNSLLLENLSTIKNQWDNNAYLYLTPHIIAEGTGIVINGVFLNWGSSTLSFGTWDVSRNSSYNSQYLFITLIRPIGNDYPA